VLESGGVQLSDRLFASYATIYATQPWVAVAVNKLARGIARLPLEGYERGEGKARSELFEGPLAELLDRPMGVGVSTFAWKSAIVGNVAVYGNCICVKVQRAPGAVVEEIWPFSPVGWRVEPNGDYVYRAPGSGTEQRFPAWRIWHVRFWAPTDSGMGMSPMEPLRRSLAIEDAAQRLGVASFANAMRPSGVLTSKEKLRDEVIQRLAASLRRIHGGVDNAFKPLLLEADLNWLPLSSSMVDAAVLGHRELTQDEVAAVYDLPQPTIGILRNANFASVDALHVMLYQDAFGVWLVMLEEDFRANVLDGVPEFARQKVEFNLNAVMRGDFNSRNLGYQRSLTWMTPNEIRALENMAPIDDPEADRLHIPGAMAPDPAEATGAQNAPGTDTSAMAALALNGATHG
jgi:HK97 family phage portal protein